MQSNIIPSEWLDCDNLFKINFFYIQLDRVWEERKLKYLVKLYHIVSSKIKLNLFFSSFNPKRLYVVEDG